MTKHPSVKALIISAIATGLIAAILVGLQLFAFLNHYIYTAFYLGPFVVSVFIIFRQYTQWGKRLLYSIVVSVAAVAIIMTGFLAPVAFLIAGSSPSTAYAGAFIQFTLAYAFAGGLFLVARRLKRGPARPARAKARRA